MRYIFSCIGGMHLLLKCKSPHDDNVDEMHVEEIIVVANAVNCVGATVKV